MHTSSTERNFFFAILAISIVFVIAILYPFLTVVILAGAFAVVLNPIYKWVKNRLVKIPWIASIITVILFLIVLCGPLFFAGTLVVNQAQDAYISMVGQENSSVFIQKINTSINKVMPSGFTFDTQAKVSDLISFLSQNLSGFFTSTLKTILLFSLMIFTIFYLLKDGKKWKRSIIELSPLSETNTKEIISKLTQAINRILKGSFLIAITQGILVGLGFAIFGVPNGALWGVLAGMASFIPTIGTSLISVPAILFLFFTGMHPQALGLLIWSVVLVGIVDNALAPYFISKDSNIPSLFILFSILGGVSLVGPVGVLIGPLALSLLYALISIYRKSSE